MQLFREFFKIYPSRRIHFRIQPRNLGITSPSRIDGVITAFELQAETTAKSNEHHAQRIEVGELIHGQQPSRCVKLGAGAKYA